MKLIPITFAGTLVAFALTAHAEDMPGMKMDDMQGMQMQSATQQAPAANAEGTIKAIDATKHSVTIAHGAAAALQWPPMTMGFAATQEQLAGLAVGDRVKFSFRMEGSKTTLVSISK
ncbi:copper-binding protein [Pseudomonas kribbensis]|jgi:Cu(I)/Ag(I) efflux system protein CusF|uniref:copper-binding protein n=1 Tax=Pseudomonas kribbensis TaxID=1628086 RepID=UPI00273A11EB|nr:copper-binding protein [Pseudomonas sp. A29(2023)]MDL5602115.1 copper-binding protein [Bacillus subtilis]